MSGDAAAQALELEELARLFRQSSDSGVGGRYSAFRLKSTTRVAGCPPSISTQIRHTYMTSPVLLAPGDATCVDTISATEYLPGQLAQGTSMTTDITLSCTSSICLCCRRVCRCNYARGLRMPSSVVSGGCVGYRSVMN